VLVEPTVLILVAAGIVHVIRRNAFDITLFFGTAVLIVLDRWRRPPQIATTRPPRLPGRQRVLVAGGFALYSIIAGQWQLDTWPMRTAMIIPGLAFAVILAVRPPVEPASAPLPQGRGASEIGKGWIVWAALAVAIALWELTSFLQQPNPIDDSYAHPTISAIVEPRLDSWWGRAIFLLLWVSAGFWLLRTIVGGAGRSTSDGGGRSTTEGGGRSTTEGGGRSTSEGGGRSTSEGGGRRPARRRRGAGGDPSPGGGSVMASRIVTMAIFAALFAALGVIELLARRGRLKVPTVGQVLRWTMRRRSAQIGVVMAWWWIGWHFLIN
jgi:hypothetical protein